MKRRGGIDPFIAGAITLVLIAIAVYFGFTKSNPFADRFQIEAAFKNANGIKAKSPVRIAGVNVGKVTSVEAADEAGRGTIVKMEIEDKGLPLHEDMRVKIRPRIFLEGNWFVELQPGSPTKPVVEEGYRVPVQNTAAPTQFGQVLTALQSDTREDLQVVLDEYGKALAGGGARGYNRSIRYWEDAFRDSAIVNDATRGEQPGDLRAYFRGATRFANGLDRSRERLQSLLTSFAITADAFASEEINLTRAIAELPRTLRTGHRALGELNTAIPPLRRLVADLRPAVRASEPALDAMLPFVRQARALMSRAELRGLVADLRPTVPDLAELNRGGVALQKQLRLLSSCTNEVIAPWRNDEIQDRNFPASGKVYQEQVKWLPGISAESRNFDANGQYVRSAANGANYAYALGDARMFLTGLPLQGINPPKAPAIPALRADVPCETQQQPDLRTVPQAPPSAIKVNQHAPGADERRARAVGKLVGLVRREVKRLGLDKQLRVSAKPLTRDLLSQLRKAP